MTGEFKTYRQKNGYAEKTIKVQNSHLNRFKEWCIKQNISPENITYNEVLNFIDNERIRNISKASVIRILNSVKIYFDYLVETKAVKQNIIRQIKLKSEGKRVLPELLSTEQLDKIYHDYSNIPQWQHKSVTANLLHQRNIVILGLLIYQGLDSGEVTKLETNHINLNEGKIYVPSGRKNNARTLKLQANQILPFKTYIEEIRAKLLEKRQIQSPYLFPAKKSSDMICKIVEQIKKIYPAIKDSRQIKASVIMNWLKQYNIRQVQYMAGHKSIRSTEAYRNQDLTDLSKQLDMFHPLK
jgi:integrase/recombinase XerD